MAPDIAMDHLARTEGGPKLLVLDPMCGSGTVLTAALNHSHQAVGFDVDPLAVLMSRVATSAVTGSQLSAEGARIASIAKELPADVAPWPDDDTQKFAEFWFASAQRSALSQLSRAINVTESVEMREALQIALSRIIVTKSPKASLAADTSHSRPHRVQETSSYDVFAGFLKSVAELGKLLDLRQIDGIAVVERGDARSIALAANTVDFVVTSPPYLNAIDYLRGHRLSLIWLGFTIPYLRNIRSNSIGAERALKEAPTDRVEAMVTAIKTRVTDPDLLPLGTITRYARDLTLFADELFRVTKEKSRVITVVGNSTLRGNYIENDWMVRLAYEDAGFKFTDRIVRDLPESSRYLPAGSRSGSSSLNKRMRSEVILDVER
jgi:DNA modification methylase